MMFDEDCEEGTFLMPLKKKKTARERNKQCLVWERDADRNGPEMKRTECDLDDVGRDDGAEPAAPQAGDEAGPPGAAVGKFVNSVEWKWTRCTANGLFRALGEYYDELWFATAIREWCLLYYRCNHTADYWQYKDEWLSGDEEVRMAVWSEILKQRDRSERRRDECLQQKCREAADGKGPDPETQRMMDTYDVATVEEALKVREMHEAVDEANELVVLKRKETQGNTCNTPEITPQARADEEIAKSELKMADPEDDPDWVEMRRRMRGSFAALNMSRCDVSCELLDHIMVELCKFWANLPEIESEVEPIMERNIMREIQNFRFKLFDMTAEDCPLPRQESERTTPACQEPEKKAPQCQEPEKNAPQCQEPERKSPQCHEKKPQQRQERRPPPCQENEPECPKSNECPEADDDSDNYCGYVSPRNQPFNQTYNLDESTPRTCRSRGFSRNR